MHDITISWIFFSQKKNFYFFCTAYLKLRTSVISKNKHPKIELLQYFSIFLVSHFVSLLRQHYSAWSMTSGQWESRIIPIGCPLLSFPPLPPPSSLPELETAHIKRTSGSSAVSVVRILHACWYNICNNKGEVAVGFLQHAKEDQICELRVSNFLSIKKCIFACINIY